MRKTALIAIGLYRCTLRAFAAAKEQSWSGWVSNSKCAVKEAIGVSGLGLETQACFCLVWGATAAAADALLPAF